MEKLRPDSFDGVARSPGIRYGADKAIRMAEHRKRRPLALRHRQLRVQDQSLAFCNKRLG
jgi:hypothetical protein